MKRVAFYPSGITISILAIAAGIVIWIYPNILQRILAILLIVSGVLGILGSIGTRR